MNEREILLVEDNPSDEELTVRGLRRGAVANKIVVARDGAEALDRLLGRGQFAGAPPPLPQVILLDLKLPKVDGIEVLRALRAHPRTRSVPVVVLTSSLEEQDLVRCYDLGANSYVRKPVDFVQFASAAQQLGLYWLLINETTPGR